MRGSVATLDHSDIQNYAGLPAGNGVIALAPLFVDIDGADNVLGNAAAAAVGRPRFRARGNPR